VRIGRSDADHAAMTGAGSGEPRPARPVEADTLHRIVNQAYSHYIARMGKAPGPMLDDYSRRIQDGQAWVLETNGTIAGLVVLEDDGQGALLLDNIAVAPSAQGQGVGRRLIAFTESEARRRGCRQVRLYTHVLMVENIALYTRLGFRETGRVSEKGFDRVYMAKSLA
jgi:ribosomal protein S18 acetylase RimI-like enzyme